MINIEHLSCL